MTTPDSKKIFSLRSSLANLFLVLLLFIGILLSTTRVWAQDAFGGVTVDELIFHIKVPLNGTDTSTIVSYIRNVLLPSLIAAPVLFSFLYTLPRLERRRRREQEARTGQQLIFRLQIGRRAFAPKAYLFPILLSKIKIVLISLLLIAFEFALLCRDFQIPSYLYYQQHPSNWLEENYIDPANVSLTWPEKKRNLIYIFLESMESSYFSKEDGGFYKESLIPELQTLADENVHFCNRQANQAGAISLTGTTWTIAGMFAQTSGLPLKTQADMNQHTLFFPGVISLGDITKAAGYHNYIMFGSDASFGGRKNYFEQHGNYEILDYNWALDNNKIPSDYRVFWGFEDSRLIDMVKEKLLEVSAEDEPFNLTMLTVDSHFPNGYRCNLCQYEHDTDYKDAISCSSRQIYDLVRWIQQQDFYENTTIVISGDHLSMSSEMEKELNGYTRTVYNCIINPAIEPVSSDDRTFNTTDMFPTTLAALGVQINGERLGLGTNLFSSQKTLAEKLGISELDKDVQYPSKFYNGLMY